jgi:hypothetical protein
MRLDWLGAEVVRIESPREIELRREWEQSLSMLEPVATEQAYARFGACLGIFPPAAIFARMLGGNFLSGDGGILIAFAVAMNVVCWLVGRKFAGVLARGIGDPRRKDAVPYFLYSLVLGLGWGAVTGASGGAVAFGIGALFGIACAVPVALLAFPLFAMLHRAQSRGGMIEARDLRPLAYGIPLTAAGIILSWH